ncbi:hypothetical protein LAG90_15445 [Marinilongibacter aquaticus]|uniref:hypothetical protein n=1 Tax=Marinilongibacter aquaticus TaxID=2975157 RepID=UPI0021BD6256|nr:hypothetical protein [Marinilongibacter aquaticus]UBM58200.1 hypothetical protein LAG90_15445 [Marinilongibacter aquaticus]
MKNIISGLIALYSLVLACSENGGSFLSPQKTLTKVYVDSGKLTGNTNFISSNAFNASDPALGSIDSSGCAKSFNAYLDSEGYLYIFEGSEVPAKFEALSLEEKSKELDAASWKQDYVYTLKNDAEICIDEANWTYYVREKGEYPRELAEIGGNKVYRYWNRYIIEDYSKLLQDHEYLRATSPPEDLYKALGLNPSEYQMYYNDKIIDKSALDYKQLEYTKKGEMDQVSFEKRNDKRVKYRLRYVYLKHDEKVLQKYFCPDGKSCDLNDIERIADQYRRTVTGNFQADLKANSDNAWLQYLRKEVIPSYKKQKIVHGYKCNACSVKSLRGEGENDAAPPLPIISNG